MTLVPRRARKLEDQSKNAVENPPEDLQKFRILPAWVLLGEPGAGKSTAFESEAEAMGGRCLRIAEFIHADPDETWNGKTLFLDGLDEIRAGAGNDSAIQLIRKQLKRLGNPPFRIACRAADWYGSSDAEDLKAASADGQLMVLQLDPLDEEDILTILRDNHGLKDPQGFVEQAIRLGVDNLLDNPQTLGLLAEAVHGDQWPTSRDDTYRLACKKLAEEKSKRHRDKTRNQPRSIEHILDAAGQLCAVLLLSDQTGIALDPERSDPRFMYLDDCAPPDPESAALAVRTKLFHLDGVERVVPRHRSVAEYLAAQWLARQIDNAGLPLERVLNLLLGQDGRTVAGLRGLYAWLALHSRKARSRLIEADPLTVVIYGDVRPMTVTDKRSLLTGLRREAERYHGFRWGVRATHPFGALADPDLRNEFLQVLQAPERDEASQTFVDCVLDIVVEGGTWPALVPTLLAIIRDSSRWSGIRKEALKAWLKLVEPHIALSLLDGITAGQITDEDDELTGTLLRSLYPAHIEPEVLLSHLHTPKRSNLIGSYVWFWDELPKIAPEEHLPILLDEFARNPAYLRSHDIRMHHLNQMADAVLARGISTYGELIAEDHLFAWLGIGADEYSEISREKAAQKFISGWISDRPERYKALLSLCFKSCSGDEHPAYCVYQKKNRLLDAVQPEDIGLWHLMQVDETADEKLAQVHLSEAINALIYQRGADGLSLEKIEAWADAHPNQKGWLEPLLAWEIPDWKLEQAANRKNREKAKNDAKRTRTIALQKQLPQILSGTARVDLMHQLAGVWMGLFSDINGETPAERFENYSDNGQALLEVAETGLRRCPERDDLPTVKEIIDLALKQKEHFIRRPCLVGMELRWRDGEAEIDKLPEETLRRMIAFRLTDGTGNTPDWFIHLVLHRPAMVAEVLGIYAGTTLKAGKDFVDGIYPLAHDATYRAVAILAVPPLLVCFPVRARTGQLHYLENLLKAALRYTPEQLPALIEKKLSMKGMDATQKVYWLATAMLIDPKQYEVALWRHVGKSEVRANHLSGFLGGRDGEVGGDYTLSVGTIGKLIERLVPHAAIERPTGGEAFWVSDAMRRGDHIRALVNHLGGLATSEAKQEINRLLDVPTLQKLKPALEVARHALVQRQREVEFHFLQPNEVAQVLANQAPTSVADLAALTLDHLDDIAREIRQNNDDGFRAFWNIENKKPISQREENLCRDVLLTRLRARLEPLGVDSQPEGDYANDKRADLRLSYRTELDLPIEIKRDSNKSLWGALRTQLIEQYAISPRANGHGIYLVLWFGGAGIPGATDGGKKPRSPEELRIRLEAQLDPMERQRIFVRVLDVSWPK